MLLAINWYGNTDLLTLNPIRFRPCCCSRPSLLTPSLRIASLLSLFSDYSSSLTLHTASSHFYSLIRVAGLWALSHQGHSPSISLFILYRTCITHAFLHPHLFLKCSFSLFLHSRSSRTFDEKGHYPRTKNIFQSCTVALVRRSSQLTLYLSTYVLRTFTPLLRPSYSSARTCFTGLDILGAFC